MIVASIPSPSSNSIPIGPLDLRMYGICIAVGTLVAVWWSAKRYEASGGDPEDVNRVAMWGIPSGIIGARLYHVITDFDQYVDAPLDAFKIWQGGLGIWGAIAGGTLGGLYIARREGMDLPRLLDAAAPAIPVAQAIGRVGNWFNQELFGGPTSLPWGLEIDVDHRPTEYLAEPTFHPTFLYEGLWNLLIAAALVLVVPRLWKERPEGRLFALYVAGYCLGRLVIELMRTDHATMILGVRINVFTSVLVGLAALYVAWRGWPGRETEKSSTETVANG